MFFSPPVELVCAIGSYKLGYHREGKYFIDKCMTLDTLFKQLEPQFPHMQNGEYFIHLSA